jgi:hypothetical protein
MVLAEESTSSTCPPCAAQNPAFDALLQANADIITSIKYHVWWPAPGNDPMYLHNPGENAARTNYYGINSVPRAIIGGNLFNDQPQYVTQTLINNAASEDAPFEIQIQHQLSPNEDSIYTTALIEATANISGALVAQLAVIEKHIHFSTPPGTNGETDFYNVMKKMLPGSNGTTLPSSMSSGDYVIFEYAWELANVYDNNELGVVGFVQNNGNKAVHQAANSSTNPIEPIYENDIELLNVTNVTSSNCSGSFFPVVEIRNNGGNNLSSVLFEYSVNGGEAESFEWTGSMDFLDKMFVEFPEVLFDIEFENEFTISAVSINGSEDEYYSNNQIVYDFDRSPEIMNEISLFLFLDDKPEETTWKVYDSNNEVVDDGGPYDTPNQQIIIPLEIGGGDFIDCYEFVIYDEGGNGICCENGLGYYAVIHNGSDIAFDGDRFGYLERNEFYFGTVGIQENAFFTQLNIFPNPINNLLNVEFNLLNDSEIHFDIVDLAGKTVYSDNLGFYKSGYQSYQVNLKNVSSGMYILNMLVGNYNHIEKINIQ